LGTVLEGEAVVNDAVAIVLFGLAGATAPGVGALVGTAVAYALRGVTEPVVEAIRSLVAAAAAYVAAEAMRASGVIGVVAAGVAFASLPRDRRPCASCGTWSPSSPTPRCSCWSACWYRCRCSRATRG
ncbi:MAG TPA: hypothetical protein VGZ23_00835, partial [bacterium]|nr:hypothetical protein [bacterium]